jgi:hypothetical protein
MNLFAAAYAKDANITAEFGVTKGGSRGAALSYEYRVPANTRLYIDIDRFQGNFNRNTSQIFEHFSL